VYYNVQREREKKEIEFYVINGFSLYALLAKISRKIILLSTSIIISLQSINIALYYNIGDLT